MKSLNHFIVKPLGERYNNTKKVGDSELILNTEMQNHLFVNRLGIVLETPINEETNIQKGDIVIVHHNVFRRYYDIRGNEKNSSSFFEEDKYFVYSDQIFMYKNNDEWKPIDGFCFVKPIKNINKYNTEKEQPLVGVLKYLDNNLINSGLSKDDLVGFTPNSEYEFVFEDERLYRVSIKSITIKYEYKGNEEEYNTSWRKSS